MARYTISDLRKAIESVNRSFEVMDRPERLKEQGRNGYQAADLYIGGKCIRNIECGTSRDVAGACWEFHSGIIIEAAGEN